MMGQLFSDNGLVGHIFDVKTQIAKKTQQEDIMLRKHNIFGHFSPQKPLTCISESLGGLYNARGQ
jgi:hypothetical protein